MTTLVETSVPTVGSGTVLADRFRLNSLIGRGGTGTVWEAHDATLDRPVAVKVLHAHLARNATALKRFRREAECARLLEHPNIVRIDVLGGWEATPFLVMERLVGVSLADCLVREGPFSVVRTIQVGAQILDALAAAHRKRLIHRDLKPANVMLVSDDGCRDVVKICDLGLAKLLDAASPSSRPGRTPTTTLAGQIYGTPQYMSPEQAQGERLDPRSDLYSVAVMLYEMLTGAAPFQGSSAIAVLSRHLFEQAPPPSQYRQASGIPRALDRLILRALAKDRRERPSTAEAFRSDLLQVAGDLAAGTTDDGGGLIPAPGSAETVRLSRGSRRLVRRVGIGAASLSLLAAAGVLGATIASRPQSGKAAIPSSPASRPVNVEASRGQPVAAGPVFEQPAPTTGRPRQRTADGPLARAESLLARGQVALACELARAMAERSPARADVHRFLGRCYLRLGDAGRSTDHYRRYLELAPNASDAVFVRAILAD